MRMRISMLSPVLIAAVFLLSACASHDETPAVKPDGWAIAIHGGAGYTHKNTSPKRIQAYRDAMQQALDRGKKMLAEGAQAIDVVEAVVVLMEDNPLFNAGKGAVFNAEGSHELDASIMNGQDLSCGAVAGVRTVKNPIRLARRVMTETRHVLLAGAGAESFADQEPGIERVEKDYFFTERRSRALKRSLASKKKDTEPGKSTVGCVVRDRHGNLAAATSTGGMTGKKFGRIGDSPIVGAGTYAANDSCAISCTGIGEEYIRHGVAHDVAVRMRYLKQSLKEAAATVIHKTLRKGDGGLIGVDKDGNIAVPFNTLSMFRAWANSTGESQVAIWE